MIKNYYTLLFISVISVSLAAIFIVSIDAHPLTIAFYRMFFTTLLILPFVFFKKKTRKEIINLSKNKIMLMIAIGIILAIHFSLWITSLKLTSVASSVILVSSHPIIVAPLSHFLLREKLSKINITGITLAIFGIVILVYGNYGFKSISIDTLEGNILALLGGFAAAFYILGGRVVRKTTSTLTYTSIVYGVSAIVLFLICIFYNTQILNIDIRDYQLIFIMAIISGIFGHTLYNWVLKYLKTSLVSVALLGEPVGSTIFAFIIPWINQIPSQYTIFGGVIIFSGIYMVAINKSKNNN